MNAGKGAAYSWDELKDGESCICGFLQLDIAKSSLLKGKDEDIQRTKENFHDFVNRILAIYGALKLKWEGDGGAFIFLIKDSADYNNVVVAAIHVLSSMPFFNGMKGLLNLLDNQDIIVKISCHSGKVIFNRDPGKIHGDTLNWFLKHEKEIMKHGDTIILTEDVYRELSSPTLQKAFEFHEIYNSKRLYKSKDWIKWFPTCGDDFLSLAVSIRKTAASNTPAGKTLLTFATESLKGLQIHINDLCSDKGLTADKATLIELTKYCFNNATCKYDGTDTHVPSEFLKAYPGYLDFHADNIRRSGISGSRILIVHDDELRRDKDKNYEEYINFLKWHEENKVPLKKIDPLIATKFRQSFELPTCDFGIWYDHYILLFEPENDDKTKLWLIYPENKLYSKCLEYFETLNRNAREFTAELFDVKLAMNWEGFVWPEKRWESEKSFLLKILEPYRNGLILDAGAGIGVEYVNLKKEGLNCFANEIEQTLRKVGGDFARKNGVSWNPYDFAWEHFGENFKSDWDVIIHKILPSRKFYLKRGHKFYHMTETRFKVIPTV
jgi:hypothetical protein